MSFRIFILTIGIKKGFGYKKIYSWFEEGFAVYLEYKIREKFLPEKANWQIEQFERVKKDDALFKEIWDYTGGYLVHEHNKKILKMRLNIKSNEKIKKYIYDFWKHFDDLYFLSGAIVMTMEEYY